MKTTPLLSAIFVLCCVVLGCDKCKNNCDGAVSIDAVQPGSNPAGYEVLLKTTGFSDSVQVVFGLEPAIWRKGGGVGDIIATVPAGLAGNVEISVEEGDCVARSGGFIVSGTLPGDVQPFLSNIVIPMPPTNNPTGIGNVWINAATTFDAAGNADQRIFIAQVFPPVGNIVTIDSTASIEYNKLVENPVSGFANLVTLQVHLNIDRTLHGGTVEHFDGQFIDRPGFLPPPNSSGSQTILLVSRETGRQLLIYNQ